MEAHSRYLTLDLYFNNAKLSLEILEPLGQVLQHRGNSRFTRISICRQTTRGRERSTVPEQHFPNQLLHIYSITKCRLDLAFLQQVETSVLTLLIGQVKVAAVPQGLQHLTLQKTTNSFPSGLAAAPTWMQFLSTKAAGQMDVSHGLNVAQEP